jgi:hypothetical protein
MSKKLTDLSGIGSKTAKSLKEKGIKTPAEAVNALERGDEVIADASSRVRSGVREYAVEERGGVYDAMNQVRVTEANQSAVEMFATTDTGSLNNAGNVTRNNESVRGSLLETGRLAAQGDLRTEMRNVPSQEEITETVVSPSPGKVDGPAVEDRSQIDTMQARRNIAEMGFDVAGNVSSFDRETIAEANRTAEDAETRGRRDPKTDFTKTVVSPITGDEREEQIRANPRETAAAKRVHNARSSEAKRVDNRRKATVTGDFDKWVNAPSQYDFPGIDTPERGASAGSGFGFTPEETQLEAKVDFTPRGQDNTFQVKETSADGGGFGRVERGAGEILSAPQEQQQVILGDLIPDEQTQEEIGLEPKGPDEEFFSFNDPLARPERSDR